MMVRLWNDNIHAHKEMFNGEMYNISPKTFVIMEKEDAINFRGQYFPYFKDSGGLQDSKSYKMLRIEELAEDDTPLAPVEMITDKTDKRRGRPPQTAA